MSKSISALLMLALSIFALSVEALAGTYGCTKIIRVSPSNLRAGCGLAVTAPDRASAARMCLEPARNCCRHPAGPVLQVEVKNISGGAPANDLELVNCPR